jgi:hypothetical protein
VVVLNVAAEVSEVTLRTMFARFGQIESIETANKRHGVVVVTFVSPSHARSALVADGDMLLGRRLDVRLADATNDSDSESEAAHHSLLHHPLHQQPPPAPVPSQQQQQQQASPAAAAVRRAAIGGGTDAAAY